MSDWELKAPVLFLIFNRPDTTQRVFESIRKAKPARLYVAADGPRPNTIGEAEKCQIVREIATSVDWDCDLHTLFRDKNLGCRVAVSTAIDWFFEHEEDGIILEDDCLPHPTFFRFCEELLNKYRDDQRIMMISGDNFQFGNKRTPYSYYFSRYAHIWGWASWSRAWKHYDVNMRLWPEIRAGRWLHDLFGDRQVVNYWGNIFERVYNSEINTWDYQWTFACLIHNGLVILPNNNLISNIGFDGNATHTGGQSQFANLTTEPMLFSLFHPPYVIRDARADAFVDKIMFRPPFLMRAILKLRRLIK